MLMIIRKRSLCPRNITLNYIQKFQIYSDLSRKFSQLSEMTKSQSQVNIVKGKLLKSVTGGRTGAYFCKTGPGEYAEHDRFLGVTNPNVRLVAKDHKELSLSDIQLLLESQFNEERLLALVILAEQYKKADLETAERIYQFYLSNLKHVNNWNLVDCSAHLILGAHLLDRDKDSLLALAQSEVLWERRVAVVATWQFIRSRNFEWTYKLAEVLLHDQHDLMHKAVGWMLREAGKKELPPLLAFLDAHAAVMPRTMLRYSIEKLDAELKKRYMAMGHAVKKKRIL